MRPRDWIPPYQQGKDDAYNSAHREAFYAFLGITPGAMCPSGAQYNAANDYAHKVAQGKVVEFADLRSITTAAPHDYSVGALVQVRRYRPWWNRLWLWLARQKPDEKTFVVTSVTSTTMTIGPN